MSTESERIAALEKGFKDAQAAAEANFDPMKGRTYIARMSPAMKRMIVEAIKKSIEENDSPDEVLNKAKKLIEGDEE